MKLYIPTTSLSADNILSCESIVPAYECQKRNFGYSYFDVLPELEPLNKVTLAFSKIPTFCTDDGERESFAMIVAVDIDDFEKFGIRQVEIINDVVVYATSTPILLTPSTTQFIFFENRAKEYTLHSCADSAKCKLFDFYRTNFILADRRMYGESLRIYTERINVPNIEPLFSENRYDKAKGFIWGYGMGTMLSLSQDAAMLLKIQKRIYDIVSSIKNDNFIPVTLAEELSRLDNEFSSIDPNQKAIKKAWETYIKETSERFLHTEIKVSEIDEFLKELGVENFVKNKFLTDNQYTLRKRLSDYTRLGNIGYETYSHDLAEYTEGLINKVRIESTSKPFSQSLDVDTASYDTVMVSADDRNSKLFNKILSRLIWGNLIPSLEELRINKAIVAKNCVIALKQIIEESGELWVNTPTQIYFNAMRKNISEFTEFNLNEIDDVVLQSVAAFLLKGEDFDSLKQYLETNAFIDYRYAFALWGAVNGYVSINRSIVENNFSLQEIHSLFIQAQMSLGLSTIISDPRQEESTNLAIELSQNPNPISPSKSFCQRVITFFDKIKKGKRQQDVLREELYLALDRLGDSEDAFEFVCILNDYSKWKNSSKAWQEMQVEFCPDYFSKIGNTKKQKNKSKKKSTLGTVVEAIGDLFSSKLNSNNEIKNASSLLYQMADEHKILEDGVLFTIIETRFPNLHKQLYKDIVWFVENYKPSYYDERKRRYENGRYRESPRDFLSVLENLDGYLHRRITSEQKWIADIYVTLPIDNIMNYLYHIYGIRQD